MVKTTFLLIALVCSLHAVHASQILTDTGAISGSSRALIDLGATYTKVEYVGSCAVAAQAVPLMPYDPIMGSCKLGYHKDDGVCEPNAKGCADNQYDCATGSCKDCKWWGSTRQNDQRDHAGVATGTFCVSGYRTGYEGTCEAGTPAGLRVPLQNKNQSAAGYCDMGYHHDDLKCVPNTDGCRDGKYTCKDGNCTECTWYTYTHTTRAVDANGANLGTWCDSTPAWMRLDYEGTCSGAASAQVPPTKEVGTVAGQCSAGYHVRDEKCIPNTYNCRNNKYDCNTHNCDSCVWWNYTKENKEKDAASKVMGNYCVATPSWLRREYDGACEAGSATGAVPPKELRNAVNMQCQPGYHNDGESKRCTPNTDFCRDNKYMCKTNSCSECVWYAYLVTDDQTPAQGTNAKQGSYCNTTPSWLRTSGYAGTCLDGSACVSTGANPTCPKYGTGVTKGTDFDSNAVQLKVSTCKKGYHKVGKDDDQSAFCKPNTYRCRDNKYDCKTGNCTECVWWAWASTEVQRDNDGFRTGVYCYKNTWWWVLIGFITLLLLALCAMVALNFMKPKARSERKKIKKPDTKIEVKKPAPKPQPAPQPSPPRVSEKTRVVRGEPIYTRQDPRVVAQDHGHTHGNRVHVETRTYSPGREAKISHHEHPDWATYSQANWERM